MAKKIFHIPVYVIGIDLAEQGLDKTMSIIATIKDGKLEIVEYHLIDNKDKQNE